MCQEVLEIVQNMDRTQLEVKMALQCAPVLTGIKISNLLNVENKCESSVRRIIRNTEIVPYRLLRRENKTVFLLFRRNELASYLREPKVQEIFKSNGYKDLSLTGILKRFRQRYATYMIQGGNFPHEMGLLLGYPIEDVQGFITHKGNNYVYAGYWKVYANLEEKKALFEAYESAKEALLLLVSGGYTIHMILERIRAFLYDDKKAEKWYDANRQKKF